MPSAIKATYSDLKIIKTRQTVQLIFEIPLADFDQAYEVLGGLPNPASESWVGIAPIRGEGVVSGKVAAHTAARPQVREQRSWGQLSPQQQAGIRCDELPFALFLEEEHPDNWHEAMNDAAECVRLICGVQSRAELETNHKARVAWHQLNDQYEAWKIAA